jgi:acetyl-CoA acetyltransferase
MTTRERARDLAQPPVAIVAGAHGLERGDGVAAFGERNFPTAHHRHVGRTLWARAGAGPDDVHVAQFYENFTGPVLMAIAEMGFCDPHDLNDFVAEGNIQWPDGRLPINTSGGNLGEATSTASERDRGGAPGSRGIDVSGRRRRAELSVSGPGFAPGSAILFGKG